MAKFSANTECKNKEEVLSEEISRSRASTDDTNTNNEADSCGSGISPEACSDFLESNNSNQIISSELIINQELSS